MVPSALHRVRFSWGQRTYVDIEWMKGHGSPIEGKRIAQGISLCELELDPDAYALQGVPPICWRHEEGSLFEPLQLRENTDYFVDVGLPISKQEAERLAREELGWPFASRLRSIFTADPPRRWREPDHASVVISGRLNVRNHAGVLDLSVERDVPLRAEVVCLKIDYLTEFQALIRQVAEYMAEILLQYDSPVSASFGLTSDRQPSAAALLFQLRYVMAEDKLPLAVEEVLSAVHSLLLAEITWRETHEVEEPSIETLVQQLDVSLLESGGPLARLFRGYTPRQLAVAEAVDTVDTPENRYVKSFLQQCVSISHWLARELESQGKAAAAREAESWLLRLEELLGHDVWHNVGALSHVPTNSQVLLRRRGYRDVLRFALSLQLGLRLPWPQLNSLAEEIAGDIRPVSDLYEYWCFFLLRRALAAICKVELANDGSFLRATNHGLQIRLAKGVRSRVRFRYRDAAASSVDVSLYYNRRFRRPTRRLSIWEGSYSTTFNPDFSIEIIVSARGDIQRHWLHFDAKYRLDQQEIAQMLNEGATTDREARTAQQTEYEQELERLHRGDDLFKMHTYRDGILSTRGAYILFPGHGTGIRDEGGKRNLFVRHPAAFGAVAPYNFPSVGAFDLCPGHEEIQLPTVTKFLEHILESVSLGRKYVEEDGLFQ